MNERELLSAASTNNYADRITTVVLTGGPCAGKTTLMEKIRNEVNSIPKVKVFFAKEAATLLLQSGVNFEDAGADETFQRLIINQQLISEHNARITAEKFAAKHSDYKVIIVCDRGIMDGAAYFKNDYEFTNLLADFELTKKTVYKRYDAVVFLRSAAVGAAQHYTTMDGTPRKETPEQAVAVDAGTYNAWCNHPKFYKVENASVFYEKLDVAVEYVLDAAKIDAPKKHFRRFLIETPNMVNLITEYTTSSTNEQIFFLNSKEESNVYYLKVQRKGNEVRYSKREVRLGYKDSQYTRVFEQDSTITENEFLKELARLNPTILPLNRTILSFYCNASIRCELEVYPLIQNHMILKVCMNSEDDFEFIKSNYRIVKEVTKDLAYSTLELARTSCNILKT